MSKLWHSGQNKWLPDIILVFIWGSLPGWKENKVKKFDLARLTSCLLTSGSSQLSWDTLSSAALRNASPHIDLYTYQVAHLHDPVSGQKGIKQRWNVSPSIHFTVRHPRILCTSGSGFIARTCWPENHRSCPATVLIMYNNNWSIPASLLWLCKHPEIFGYKKLWIWNFLFLITIMHFYASWLLLPFSDFF